MPTSRDVIDASLLLEYRRSSMEFVGFITKVGTSPVLVSVFN